MSAPIPYTVQSGETLQDIAKKLGIKDWTKLKQYHNEQAGSGQQTSDIPYAGFTLQTPPKDEIYTMNGETPPPDPVEEQKSAEQKQDQEKKKEEEEKKEEKASKSDHDGKYFVVHNAKCVCDKAENPKQTADLQVTTHSIIVLNDEQGKLAATEEDKTFMPPAATFGKCKLKPSSGGYLPCALAPASKWGKTYESTQVMGKNTLTEISELQCTVGGKITIFKHGQTDSVSNAHADNTNPVELAMVNPAIDQPKKKEEYPSVTSIVLTKVENRTAFKEIDSKNKSGIIYLRKDEEASFKAHLKSGNKQLTSWMVYSDHQGKKENRIFLREQIGTEFSQSFEGLGKFRIEGYGKPKNQDFEKGKYDKCDPSCSIDVEVVENTLIDIECTSADFTTRIDPSKNRKFRKGVPSVFKAKFFIPDLTAEEKSRLTLSVQDGSGNTITEGVQENGEILTFTPKNTKAKYTIIARYTNDKGEVIEKQIAGETEGNAVLGISHGAEVVRPGTAMSFSVSKMKYKFGEDNSTYDLTSDESSEIKWNLNGIFQGTGKSFTIAGSKLMAPGKYIVEAYSISANATGKNAKKEDDDWHFEVKENDVVSFTLSGAPKVGKPITATVDKMVFADLLPNETVHWQGFSTPVTGKSITFTPKTPGTLSITSKIKGKGVTQKVNVVEAKIVHGFWNDFGGSEISQAAWGQKVDFCIKGENIEGEEIEFAIYDSDHVSGDDFGYSNTENKLKITGRNDKTYASHRIELTKKVKDRTANDLSSEVKLYGKAKLLGFENSTLKDITPVEKTSKYLTVNNEKTVYRAIIGEQNGRARHMPVDYDMISWVYASTTYPKGTKLKIKIFEDINWAIDRECKELLTTGTVGEDGTLAAQINWGKLKDAKQNKKTKKYYAIIYDEKDNELLNGSSSDTLCNTTLIPKSILLKEASYTGAVIVGSEQAPQLTNSNGVCEYEARVKAFMRMLRVGEGTDSEKGYTTQFSGKQFSDMSNHPHEVITANGYSSSAAGAYQTMADTYDGLKVYRTKYNITNFNQESQDKLCLVILKHNYTEDRPNSFYNPIYWKDKNKTIRDTERENSAKERRKKFKGQQADIIKLIIDNDIKKATLLSSLCWASLPDAPYGQPTETAEECKANYEKFLKEELTNKQTWKLHLKDGFLKEFGYSCCGEPVTTPSSGCGGKTDIDLRSKMTFYPQKTSTDCNLQCRKIMSSLKVVPENPSGPENESFYQTAIESKDHKNLILNADDLKNGMTYIDKSLEAGYPIMVGVNHTLNYGYNETTNTTDHYVIIVGRFCDNGILKYRFWDVATRRGAEGDFKFTLTTEKLYSDNVWKAGRIYTLTQIRRNMDSKGKLITF